MFRSPSLPWLPLKLKYPISPGLGKKKNQKVEKKGCVRESGTLYTTAWLEIPDENVCWGVVLWSKMVLPATAYRQSRGGRRSAGLHRPVCSSRSVGNVSVYHWKNRDKFY